MGCRNNFLVVSLICLVTLFPPSFGQRRYDRLCPLLPLIVRGRVREALRNDARMAASLLRLHFHDCMVNGCDASVLLDDTDNFKGEKNAPPNRNSLRGYEVIDRIKADVERACPLTVSCADIVALVARDAVVMSGGPYWDVTLGRRDGLTASDQAALDQLPSPFEPLQNIVAKFISKGLDLKDLVVLSGAHTIGFAQCFTFKGRLYDFKGSGEPDPTLDPSALTNLQGMCPNQDSSNSNLAPLDPLSIYRFDNLYYSNLARNAGLLETDQLLMGDQTMASMIRLYGANLNVFFSDFVASMQKMGNLGILTGDNGQIRKQCGSVN